MSITHRLVGDELWIVELWMLGFVAVNTILNLSSKLPDQTLHGPGSCISKRADSVSFDLERELLEHVNFGEVSVTDLHSLEHVNHPACALTTRCALSAALVLVEFGETEYGVDHICFIIHDNDGGRAQARSAILEIVKVHYGLATLLLVEHGDGGAAGDDSLQVVPATDDSATMAFNQLTKGNAHFLLDRDWVVDMSTDAEELGARVLVTSKTIKPACSAAHDSRADGHGLHVSHSGRASV